MKQSLQLRVSQHLALTPQLQQSIRLLQLSTLELQQELEHILAENPMLERVDDPLDHSVRLLADGAVNASAGPAEKSAAEDAPAADGEAPSKGVTLAKPRKAATAKLNGVSTMSRAPARTRKTTMPARNWKRTMSPCASTCSNKCAWPRTRCATARWSN